MACMLMEGIKPCEQFVADAPPCDRLDRFGDVGVTTLTGGASGRFSNVTISDGTDTHFIVSFPLAMARLEIAKTVNDAADATTEDG
jgi:hypothetical protein